MRNFLFQLHNIKQSTYPGQSHCKNGLKFVNYDPMRNIEGGTTSQTEFRRFNNKLDITNQIDQT